ncbi:Predicted thiol-disulfide oxidoreductase YuxK, DCC family [Ferrithrix thermotolerans DSM 19514]|uniref:Predicted thiol-disulfide oxidoreductase YuxK, DCC family n=1 Tax=Ferrithrix thermotolerans DSM 19514 TaxID=1121881 RepID=A0A1M4WJV1_9ACTN|nr:Predicted thiol-disulfide oxidoreductase YuxK, DCC family [Ferrithrix thermotolerans DSM 19514]
MKHFRASEISKASSYQLDTNAEVQADTKRMEKVLLFDGECSLCFLAQGFVKASISDNATDFRAYQGVQISEGIVFDPEMAKRYVALFDASTLATFYGVDAVVQLLFSSDRHIARLCAALLSHPKPYKLASYAYDYISKHRRSISLLMSPFRSASFIGRRS